jgi:hypothetical protein
MVAQPQDRKPSVQEMLHNALQLQGANFAMKGQLDMMATKIILVLKVQKAVWERIPKRTTGTAADLAEAMGEIGRILSMTRDETAEARKGFEYDDPRIQAVINRAAQELCDILLENGQR